MIVVDGEGTNLYEVLESYGTVRYGRNSLYYYFFRIVVFQYVYNYLTMLLELTM